MFKFNHLPEYKIFGSGVSVTVAHEPTGIQVTNGKTPNMQQNAEAAYDDCVDAVARYNAALAPKQVTLYGCHDKPRPNGATWAYVQDGYFHEVDGNGKVESRTPRLKKSFHVMSTECKYDKSATDSMCKGCKHGSAT